MKSLINSVFYIITGIIVLALYQIFLQEDTTTTKAADAFCSCSKVGSTVGVLLSDLDDDATELCLDFSSNWKNFENKLERYSKDYKYHDNFISLYKSVIYVGRFAVAVDKKCPDKLKD